MTQNGSTQIRWGYLLEVHYVRNFCKWFRLLGLYFDTVRHLRLVQITNRIVRRFSFARIHETSSKAMPCSTPSGRLTHFPLKADPFASDGKVQFLNTTDSFQANGWGEYNQSMLWKYNLHYFDTLRSDVSQFDHRNRIEEWIQQVECGASIAWDPYPTSLRVLNWIYWHLCSTGKSFVGLSATGLDSLRTQLDYLEQNIEWHLLGNHLFENGKTLFVGGLFFEGAKADRFLRIGTKILEKELAEQILEDGAHFELSPMYHAIVLSGLLELLSITRVFPYRLPPRSQALVQQIEVIVPKMLEWLAFLTHRDGQFGLFNDCAYGISSDLRELSEFALQLGIQSQNETSTKSRLLKSGYCRLEFNDAVVLADFAGVGPQYQPGHAHADTLSFEFSIGIHRIIVNSGTSTYEKGVLRSWQRSTMAHNTLEIEGKSSSETWGAFRVAKRAHVVDKAFEQTDHSVKVQGTHNGYRRLGLKAMHTRKFSLSERFLEILDEVDQPVNSKARLYLHPNCEVRESFDNKLYIKHTAHSELEIQLTTNAKVTIEDSIWHPEFGVEQANKCIVLELMGQNCWTRINWHEKLQ